MSIDVRAEVLIHCPREQVAAYAMNPALDPVWIGGIVEAKALTELPVQVGTRVARSVRRNITGDLETLKDVLEHGAD